jgi:hypothetical protein
MKMRFFIVLTAITLFFVNQVFSQGYVESALLFGSTRPGGSARIQGIGGAQISLGGDYSSALSNPAGLGMYNRSEVFLTPALTGISTRASYFDNNSKESTSKLQVPGLGAVFHFPASKEDGAYIGGSLAITYNRINDFNGAFSYRADNNESSIIESFKAGADGATTDQFFEGDQNTPAGYNYNTAIGLAYFNYLIGPASTIDPSYPDDEYFTDVQSDFTEITSPARQSEEVKTTGASNQWNISYGANFSDKFFIGGGVGIASIRYESSQLFRESFDNDPNFRGLTLDESLEIRGSGVNATLGAIFRPVDFVQLGLSYTTPTYYGLTETYDAEMSTSWKNFDYYGDGETILNEESASTDIVTLDYSLTVPSKLSAGVTFISKFGFITGDVEYTNPSNLKYSSDIDGVSFNIENDDISRTLNSVLNYRVGAEYRFKIYRARAGYASMGNPFAGEVDLKNVCYSGGLGVRMDRFYIDFALVHRRVEQQYAPYTIGDYAPVVDLKRNTTSGMITIGLTY